MTITSAKEVWENQDKSKWEKQFEERCDYVMNSIKRASGYGMRSCCFECSEIDKDTGIYYAVKQEFIKNGYTFKPTGYSNGVWQTTEDICW